MTSTQNLPTASDNSTQSALRFVSAHTSAPPVRADTNRKGGESGPATTRFRAGGVAVGLAALLISACGATTSVPSAGAEVPPILGDESGVIGNVTVPTIPATTLPEGSLPTPPPPTVPPATAPPTVPPPPTTPPPPPTVAPTTPPPQPVTVDLLAGTTFRDDVRADDGAGGSGEARQAGSNVVGVRSFAWHGYNGSGFASATLSREFDATEMFDSLGESVSTIDVELSFAIRGSGVLQGPYDRSSTVSVTAYVQDETVELFEETKAGNDEYPIATPSFDTGASRTLSLTRDEPVVYFSVVTLCESNSGAQAFSLFRESYCDFYEAGSVELTLLQATLTPGL